MTDTLSIKQLNLTLSGTHILRDISMSVRDGQMVALIGPNGSGKTSLLNCIGGLQTDFTGTVTLDNQNVSEMKQTRLAQQLAYLHQHMPANLNLTAQQVVELGLIPHLSPWGRLSQSQQVDIQQAIHRVGLNSLAERAFSSLSGGEKQRVLIAKTIVQRPMYLLMDEPTNHLDIRHQMDTLSMVKSLGLTTIACIHDVNLALAVCDHIVCLNDGAVVFDCPSSEVKAEDFAAVYDIECQLDNEPYHGRKRLNIRWQS